MDVQTAVTETLRRSRTCLQEADNWAQGHYAATREGSHAWTTDWDAPRMSAVATIRHFAHHLTIEWDRPPGGASRYDHVANTAIDLVAAQVPHKTLTAFNHDPATTHADVLAAFDRAIEAAESQAECAAA